MKAIIVVATLIATHASQVAITSQQAQRIVEQEVFRNDPKMSLSQYSDRNDPDFYFIEAAWDNSHGSMIAGHFAVNSRTATLWNLQGSVCGVLTSAKLASLQQKLRHSFRMDRPTFARLTSKRPILCSIIERMRSARAY